MNCLTLPFFVISAVRFAFAETAAQLRDTGTKDDQEYIVVEKGAQAPGTGWKTGSGGVLTFDSLTPNEEYDLYTRKKTGSTYSANSAPRSVKTLTQAPAAVDEQSVTVGTDSITISSTADSQQYVAVPKDTTPSESDWSGGKYGNGGALTLDGLTPGQEYDLYTRKTVEDFQPSAPSAALAVSTNALTLESLPAEQKPTAQTPTYSAGGTELVTEQANMPGGYTTVKYRIKAKNGEPENEWSTEIPKAEDAGDYTVETQYSGQGHDDFVVETPVTIARKAITITAKEQTIPHGGSIVVSPDQVTLSLSGLVANQQMNDNPLVGGQQLTGITLTAKNDDDTDLDTTQADGVIGKIVPSDAVIRKGDVDKSANYAITYASARLTVRAAQEKPTDEEKKELVSEQTTDSIAIQLKKGYEW